MGWDQLSKQSTNIKEVMDKVSFLIVFNIQCVTHYIESGVLQVATQTFEQCK
jgi:hypothetical protein